VCPCRQTPATKVRPATGRVALSYSHGWSMARRHHRRRTRWVTCAPDAARAPTRVRRRGVRRRARTAHLARLTEAHRDASVASKSIACHPPLDVGSLCSAARRERAKVVGDVCKHLLLRKSTALWPPCTEHGGIAKPTGRARLLVACSATPACASALCRNAARLRPRSSPRGDRRGSCVIQMSSAVDPSPIAKSCGLSHSKST
jgi:hypothetical protein